MEPTFHPKKVVLALISDKGKFLLIRRKLPSFKVEWAFPGGIIEGEETEEQAVVREVKEEVCLDVEVVKRLLERKHPNTFVQVVYFDCKLKGSPVAAIGEAYEIAEIEWVDAKEVLNKFTSDVDPLIQKFILSRK
ncbi:MAG: NUDIX hydrolase [Candidatus Microgenomates bacterium]|jgi:8-oxo-dGTP diphosphatase